MQSDAEHSLSHFRRTARCDEKKKKKKRDVQDIVRLAVPERRHGQRNLISNYGKWL